MCVAPRLAAELRPVVSAILAAALESGAAPNAVAAPAAAHLRGGTATQLASLAAAVINSMPHSRADGPKRGGGGG